MVSDLGKPLSQVTYHSHQCSHLEIGNEPVAEETSDRLSRCSCPVWSVLSLYLSTPVEGGFMLVRTAG